MMQRFASWSDEELAQALDALSNPVRLAIARALKEPRCLSEIDVAPSGLVRGPRIRGTILARQTVKEHLDRLVSVGIVSARKVQRERGEFTEYVLDQASLVTIAEAFDDLARFFAKEPDQFVLAPLVTVSSG